MRNLKKKRMPLKIKINNLNGKRKISGKIVRKAAERVLRKSGLKTALVDITFVGNRKIKTLNAEYMKRQSPTDVISFTLEGCDIRDKKGPVGDVYISSDMAWDNARRFGTSYEKEILLYVIHGMLHLLGFGDKTAREKKKIQKLEKQFLKQISSS